MKTHERLCNKVLNYKFLTLFYDFLITASKTPNDDGSSASWCCSRHISSFDVTYYIRVGTSIPNNAIPDFTTLATLAESMMRNARTASSSSRNIE